MQLGARGQFLYGKDDLQKAIDIGDKKYIYSLSLETSQKELSVNQ